MLPEKPPAAKFDRAAEWLQPKHWANQTVVLFFVCPITMTAVGSGCELKRPRDWVKKYGAAIRVGLTMLSIGAGVARLAGVPVPNLHAVLGGVISELGEQDAFLGGLTAGIAESLADGLAENVLSQKVADGVNSFADSLKQDGGPDEMSPEVKQAVKKSYGEVLALLDAVEPKSEGKDPRDKKLRDPKRCGLVKAVCTREEAKPVEWVEEKWAGLFEERGQSLLGMSREQLALLSGAPATKEHTQDKEAEKTALLPPKPRASRARSPAAAALLGQRRGQLVSS